jgi:hypothetical protein
MEERPAVSKSRLPLWIIIAVCGVIGASGVAWVVHDVFQRAERMRPAATPASVIMQAAPGTRVQGVMRVDGPIVSDSFQATLLDKQGEASFSQTSSVIRLSLSTESSVVMGGIADVKPGAVIQAAGAFGPDRTFHASQIVILTKYVHIVKGGAQ